MYYDCRQLRCCTELHTIVVEVGYLDICLLYYVRQRVHVRARTPILPTKFKTVVEYQNTIFQEWFSFG